MAGPHLISSSNLLPSLIAAHQAHSEYKFLPSSIYLVPRRDDDHNDFKQVWRWRPGRHPPVTLALLPVWPLWGNFRAWRWSEKSAQSPTSKSVSGCHRAVAPTTAMLLHFVFYPLRLLFFYVWKYYKPPWNRNCHPCDPLINQQWLLAPQVLE